MNIWFNKQISETVQHVVWNLPALFGAPHSWYKAHRCHTDIARLVKARNSILGKDATLQRKWCNVSNELPHRKNCDIALSHHVKFITKLEKFASASWMQMLLKSTDCANDCASKQAICDKNRYYHQPESGDDLFSHQVIWFCECNMKWSTLGHQDCNNQSIDLLYLVLWKLLMQHNCTNAVTTEPKWIQLY